MLALSILLLALLFGIALFWATRAAARPTDDESFSASGKRYEWRTFGLFAGNDYKTIQDSEITLSFIKYDKSATDGSLTFKIDADESDDQQMDTLLVASPVQLGGAGGDLILLTDGVPAASGTPKQYQDDSGKTFHYMMFSNLKLTDIQSITFFGKAVHDVAKGGGVAYAVASSNHKLIFADRVEVK